MFRQADLELTSLDRSATAPDRASALVVPAVPPSRGVASQRRVRLSLVIPTYNEGKSVTEIVRQLSALLDGPLAGEYELIVVDDDSPDRTWEVAEALTDTYPRLRVIRRQGERGLSTAVLRGWQAARGDVLAVIDADLQHPPEVALKLWREVERGADLAVASRHVEGGGVSDWAVHRRLLSRGAQLLGLAILPSVVGRVSDPMSGYFMVRRSAIANRPMTPLGYKILVEVLGRGAIGTIGEVGYVFRERLEGESKVTGTLYIDYLRHLVRLRLATVPMGRFARFALVGLSGVVVDMGLLFLLVDPRMLGLGLVVGKVLAAEVAVMNNFLWNDAWTFGDRARSEPGLVQKAGRFLKFNAVCAVGILLNVLLLRLECGLLGLNVYLANAIAIGIVTLWNFWMNASVSWGKMSAIPSTRMLRRVAEAAKLAASGPSSAPASSLALREPKAAE